MKSILYIGMFFVLIGCKQSEKSDVFMESNDVKQEVVHPWADKASYQNAPDELRDWVDGRAGTGDPVHWVADGGVFEYPSGKKTVRNDWF